MSTILPAAAGYFVIWPGTRHGYRRIHVMGWDVSTRWPVTPIEDDIFPEGCALLCPDGTVNALSDAMHWPSVDAWLDDEGPSQPSHMGTLVG